jgi:hypothetical protein
MSESQFREVEPNPAEMFIAGSMDIGVGEIVFTVPNEDNEERTIQVSLLTFTAWGTTDQQLQIAVPMGHPLGDLFYTGELTMSLREMWEEWWKEHPQNGTDGTDRPE